MRSVRQVVALIIAFSAVATPTSSARADDVSEAREHYKKGTSAFELGQYDEAIAEYAATYRLRSDPALLYNLGQAHRLANHPTEALHFYKIYLTKVPDAGNRHQVEGRIAELQRQVEEQKEAQSAQPAPVRRSEVPATSGDAAPTPVVLPAAAAVTMPPRPRSNAMRNAGIGLAAGGAVVLALGGTFAGLSKSAGDTAYHSGTYDHDADNRYQSYQATEIAAFAVGGAALATGAALLTVALRRTHR